MQNLFFKIFVPIHAWVLRTFKGRVLGNMGGAPVLTLTVPGRKSGRVRTVPLLYLRDGDRYVVIASKGGSPAEPRLVRQPDCQWRRDHSGRRA